MTLTDLARRFVEQNGLPWHELTTNPILSFGHKCSCGKPLCKNGIYLIEEHLNPDLLDARVVVDICKGWNDWYVFLSSLIPPGTDVIEAVEIIIDLMQDRTGKMLRAAVKWRREHPREVKE